MINAAIAGLGWWGKTLVEAVSDVSDDIRFVAGDGIDAYGELARGKVAKRNEGCFAVCHT